MPKNKAGHKLNPENNEQPNGDQEKSNHQVTAKELRICLTLPGVANHPANPVKNRQSSQQITNHLNGNRREKQKYNPQHNGKKR